MGLKDGERRRSKKAGPGITETAFPTNHVTVTPGDGTVYSPPVMLYVGTSGDVTCKDMDGEEATYVGVPAGAMVPVRVTEVLASTTAGDLVGVY